MPEISKIDKNLAASDMAGDGLCYTDVQQPPFAVYGLMREAGRYCRMPAAVAASVNEGVANLAVDTAGGRVRFCTDSDTVAIRARMHAINKFPHMPLTGSAGFDMYINEGEGLQYYRSFVPPMDMEDGFESSLPMPGRKMREVLLHFPLYSGVISLEVGLAPDAALAAAPAYGGDKPIVYYGSSITQGGCASRPGSAYQAAVARALDRDFINLGFSGSARGEKTVTDYIIGLEMDAFVMDYDHNAPTPEYLAATHKPMFDAIRAAHPRLPILLMSRPMRLLNEDDRARRAVVEATWQAALAAGDAHVAFLDGPALIPEGIGDEHTVDACHPTDLGFAFMASAVTAALRELLKNEE